MYSECLSVRFRKMPCGGLILFITLNITENHYLSKFRKTCLGDTRKSLGKSGSVSWAPGSVFCDLMMVQNALGNLCFWRILIFSVRCMQCTMVSTEVGIELNAFEDREAYYPRARSLSSRVSPIACASTTVCQVDALQAHTSSCATKKRNHVIVTRACSQNGQKL